MNDQALTRALSEFAVGEVSLNEAGWRHAASLFANALAVGAGAAREPQVERLESVVRRIGGATAEASLWGRGGRLQAEWSAFLNAYATDLHDHDDTHLCAMIHVGPVVVPVAVAVAELRGLSVGRAIEATYVGAEVAIRVALGLGPRHLERGWHVTGTAGVVGAAATAARLLGHDPDLAEQCLGLGATQAAGITAQYGTDAWALHPAKAALNGIESARLVGAGLDGPRRILEGRRGLFALAADEPCPNLVLEGLGREWRVLDYHPRPYACGPGRVTAGLDDRSRVCSPQRPFPREALAAKVEPVFRQRHDEPGVTAERLTGLEDREHAFDLRMATLLQGL